MRSLATLDLELLHHYSISTSLTLSHDPIVRDYLQVNVPQQGFQHPYVMNSILALAAAHLAHFRPESRNFYQSEATARHTAATSIATPLLSAITADNSVPMYCFSILTMFISFASLRTDDDPLLDDDNAMPSWLALFRGVRTVLESNSQAIIYASSISHLFSHRPGFNTHFEPVELQHDALTEFENYIDASTSDEESTRCLLQETFRELKRSYWAFYGEELGNEAKVRSLFTWLYKASDEYMNMLQSGDNKALCILAFFCVLIHRLEYNWWLKGWGTYLIGRIHSTLDETHRYWLKWPIQEIGWIPRRDKSVDRSMYC